MTTETNTQPANTEPPDLNYYDLLQVSPKAETEIIEAAYRKLALRYHPDHNSSPQATGMMQALNAAYATLKDPQRRADYDTALTRGFASYDDLSDEDYEPPQPHYRSMLDRFGWLGIPVVIGLILFIVLNALSQLETTSTGELTPTQTASAPRPTLTLPPGTFFFDDLDSVAGANWRLDPPWHLTSRYSRSGKFSLWFGDENQGRYQPNLSASAALARPVGLPDNGQPRLSFWLSGQSDHDRAANGEDRLFVEVAPGGQDFQTIYTANGLYQTWQEISLDLSKWRGKGVVIRFRFSSGTLNSGAGFSGFFLDDIKISQ